MPDVIVNRLRQRLPDKYVFGLAANIIMTPSRRPGSSIISGFWTPAFAGVTWCQIFCRI
jgi:hypothetical protein